MVALTTFVWLLTSKGAEGAAEMVIISNGKACQDHADVAAVEDVHAEDAAHGDEHNQ